MTFTGSFNLNYYFKILFKFRQMDFICVRLALYFPYKMFLTRKQFLQKKGNLFVKRILDHDLIFFRFIVMLAK